MNAAETCSPWAMRLAADRLPFPPPSYATVELDAASQTARYLDAAGQVIEMGKHGTNRTLATTSKSGGPDGEGPRPQVADDSTPDYESD
ncbi:putative ATP-grasp-modified RiPP [Actinomadura atramentaria]|uniref:putative ATP-grasp-modified RiPP n=1 Tax=Actinomadura atramentaria TaxID=1990 RepID=UPI000373024B|nr:putative ATP-grasp-modified RiPP [Actinomadura atramentaria]